MADSKPPSDPATILAGVAGITDEAKLAEGIKEGKDMIPKLRKTVKERREMLKLLQTDLRKAVASWVIPAMDEKLSGSPDIVQTLREKQILYAASAVAGSLAGGLGGYALSKRSFAKQAGNSSKRKRSRAKKNTKARR
jgi:hypothetical protein